MRSIVANSSAIRSGCLMTGKGLPIRRIFTRLVIRARIAASTFITLPMQNGLPWCSLSATPSKPSSSARTYSSR